MLLEEIFINNSKLLLDKQLFRMSSPLKADGYLYVEITDTWMLNNWDEQTIS